MIRCELFGRIDETIIDNATFETKIISNSTGIKITGKQSYEYQCSKETPDSTKINKRKQTKILINQKNSESKRKIPNDIVEDVRKLLEERTASGESTVSV